MRRARPKLPRIRVVKHRPKRSSGAPNQIHDEDVLRWRRTFNDEEALTAARMAGPGVAGLAVCPDAPALSPESCTDALQYISTLPEDARQAVFKHCELVARHERMLREGAERLKYVQAQVREMKAQLPPPLPPPRPRDMTEKGPDVTAEPIPEPACWASCCGLMPLPPLPAPPPPPPRVGPLVVRMPDEAYFREAAARTDAAARRTVEWEREVAKARSGGGASSESTTPLEPLAASGSAPGDTPPAGTEAAGGARHATEAQGAAAVVSPAELPGQLDGPTAAAAAAGPAGAATPPLPPLPPPPVLSPLGVARAPGAPQSLLRPLRGPSPSPAPLSGAGASPAPAPAPALGGSRPTQPLSSPPPRSVAAADSVGAAAASVLVAPSGGGGGGGTVAAGPVYDLTRYQDPESIREITRIQAAQRGRMARKQVAGVRAQQQRQQKERQPVLGGAASVAVASEGEGEGEGEGAGAGRLRSGGESARERGEPAAEVPDLVPAPAPPSAMEAAAAAAAQWPHPFADPEYGAGSKLPPLPGMGPAAAGGGARNAGGGGGGGGGGGATAPAAAAAAAAAGSASAGGMDRPVYDLTRYQDPETIRKVTRIQAAQRGRMARKQVADIRSQQRQQQQQHVQEQASQQQAFGKGDDDDDDALLTEASF